MTVAINTLAVKEYIGTDGVSLFSVPFPTFETSNVEAEVYDNTLGVTTPLALTTDFTLTNVGKPGVDASLTLVSNGKPYLTAGKLKTGFTLFIKFDADSAQPMKGRDWGTFAPEAFERTLDRLSMNIKAVKAIADKAISVQSGDGANVKLPALPGNAGKIMKVSDDESGFDYGPTVTTIETWKNDAMAARDTARTYRDTAVTASSDAHISEVAATSAATNAASQAAAANASKLDAQNAATGAASSQALAAQSVFDANAEKNAAVTAKVAAETARDLAIAAANDTTVVAGYKTAAEAARDAAITAKVAAQTAQTGAQTAKTLSEAARDASVTAKVASQTAQAASETARDDSVNLEAQAHLWAERGLYDRIVNLTVANSPYTVNEDTEQNVMFIVDDSGGNVTINLPLISDTADHVGWKIGVLKKVTSANSIILDPKNTDTINFLATMSVNDPKLGALVYAGSPTNWSGRLFTDAILAANALPPGGNIGDMLSKKSTIDGDAEWLPNDSIINSLIFG